jgi:predicted dinucleotide-binding enzyme
MPLDVLVAGDDAEAKALVALLIESGGLRALDVGPLVCARQLEALGLLHIALQITQNTGFMTAIKIISQVGISDGTYRCILPGSL